MFRRGAVGLWGGSASSGWDWGRLRAFGRSIGFCCYDLFGPQAVTAWFGGTLRIGLVAGYFDGWLFGRCEVKSPRRRIMRKAILDDTRQKTTISVCVGARRACGCGLVAGCLAMP